MRDTHDGRGNRSAQLFVSVEYLFGKTLLASELRIKLLRKTRVFCSESSPQPFAMLKKLISFVFGEATEYIIKIAKKASYCSLHQGHPTDRFGKLLREFSPRTFVISDI